MMLRVALTGLVAALVGACGLSVVGGEPATTTDAGAGAGGNNVPAPAMPDSGSQTTLPEAGATSPPTSCKDLHQRDASIGDGVQTVDPDGDGPSAPFQVWCDMTTDGGGWTLAGRSVQNGGGDFGWSSKAGSPGDTTTPYSLDVYDAGIIFEHVLLRGETNAFEITIPASFDQLQNTNAQTGGASTIAGTCSPNGGPNMLGWMGHIGSTAGFFFRNLDSFDAVYGLRPSGWNTFFGNCPGGGDIDTQQGSILIR